MGYVRGAVRAAPTIPALQQQIAQLLQERESHRQTIETLKVELARAQYQPTPIKGRGKEAKCGTYAGYTTHLRDKQEPCRPCKDANTEYQRLYRARKKEARRGR